MEDGLIVPVIHNADEKNIVGLARSTHDLATRARENRLQPDEVTGGTFTLNNPGTLGSLFSTPIIVQPQAAILSMEAVVKKPVVIDDAIAIRPMMNLSLSLDHHILDGLSATRFLATVKKGLETFPVDASIY
jgi:2-oxoisovalerate dehydrogenase E2 component (dihydrolipoyl transacylase)